MAPDRRSLIFLFVSFLLAASFAEVRDDGVSRTQGPAPVDTSALVTPDVATRDDAAQLAREIDRLIPALATGPEPRKAALASEASRPDAGRRAVRAAAAAASLHAEARTRPYATGPPAA